MSLGPLDTAPVIERVRTQLAALRNVQGAAEFAAAAEASTVVTPSAFVLLAQENAASVSGGSQMIDTQHQSEFSVVLAVRNYQQSQLGMAQAATLRALISALRIALVGWSHPDFEVTSSRSVRWKSGRLLRYDAATIWWQETFVMSYWSRV